MFRVNGFKSKGPKNIDAPDIHSYETSDDTLAQVLAADYFADPRAEIRAGDMVLVKATDGSANCVVTNPTTIEEIEPQKLRDMPAAEDVEVATNSIKQAALNGLNTSKLISDALLNSSALGNSSLINSVIQRYFVNLVYGDYYQFTAAYSLTGSWSISVKFLTTTTSFRTLCSTAVPLTNGFRLSMDGTTGVVSFDADNGSSTISIDAGASVNNGVLHTAKIRFDSATNTYYLSVDGGIETSAVLAGVTHDLKYIAKDGDAGGVFFVGTIADCEIVGGNVNDFYKLNSAISDIEYSTSSSGNSLSYVSIPTSARVQYTETEGGWLGEQLVSDWRWSNPAVVESEWEFVANKWVLSGSGASSVLKILEAADTPPFMLMQITASGVTGDGLATQRTDSTNNRIIVSGDYNLIFNSALGSVPEFKRVLGVVNGTLSKPNFYALIRKSLQSIHTIGDSFVNSILQNALNPNFVNRYTALTYDGVGGSTLAAQKIRFDATPQFYNDVLIIMDGGFDDTSAAAIIAIDAMVAHLTHDKWVYVQPSPREEAEGTTVRDDWNIKVAEVVEHVGQGHYVECLTALKAGNDGSAEDLEDVANNIVPRSLRVDIIHENANGATIRAKRIADHIKFMGW